MLRPRDPNPGRMWTAERLRTALATSFRGESIVVLANREPFRHDRAADGGVSVRRSTGGLVTALEPLLQACSGVWVAHGSGTADRCVVDRRNRLNVPPTNPSYRLRRVWLDEEEERGYYGGFSNEGLWPLCHRAHVQPIFRTEDFKMYQAVNTRFAEAVCEEVKTKWPLVLVQDYHFALAPQAIRDRLPSSTIVTFWHIPWPHPRDYAVCPWDRQLVEGLLGSSIVGFQTPEDCLHFIETVSLSLNARIDRRHQIITYDDRQVAVRAYPVSIEWPSQWTRQSPPVDTCRADVRRQLGLPPDIRLIVGVDRLDYTKGLDEKVRAVERLLELHPEFNERVVLAQIAEPSRTSLAAYQAHRARLVETKCRVNARFGSDTYRPIVLLESHHEPADIYRFLRAADICYVGSLHDGMNLVAKEFVAARDDHRGVLILSKFAGAARALTAAIVVNPYAIDDCAEAVVKALHMSDEEQSTRMRALRSVVAEFNTYQWAGRILADAARIRADRMHVPQDHQTRWQRERLPA
jgi:trehalose 6-phosphate synthase